MINLGITVLIILVAVVTLGVEAVRLQKIWRIIQKQRQATKDAKTIEGEIETLNASLERELELVRTLRRTKEDGEFQRKQLDERLASMTKQLVTFVHQIDSSFERKQRIRLRIDVCSPAEAAKDSRWYRTFPEYFHVAETWASSDDEALQCISLSSHVMNHFTVGRPMPADAETPV